MNPEKTCLLLGASGLVGSHLLRLLLGSPRYRQVVVLVRRPLGVDHEKLKERVVDFKKLSDHASAFEVNDLFCCLGTTMSVAGSREAFRLVDFEIPLEAAKLAAQQKCERAFVITAVGSHPKSRIFYSRTKGELEEALQREPFQSISVFRPSFILGQRGTLRFGELLGKHLFGVTSFAMIGPLRKYRPVQAEDLAKAMLADAQREPRGIHIFEEEIHALAEAPI